MKNYVKIFLCMLLSLQLFSCSGDDNNGSTNNDDNNDGNNNGNTPAAAVTFGGNGITINSLSLDEYPLYKNEAIFTTLNNVSIILYFKKGTQEYQTTADGEQTYNADGVPYFDEPDYPLGVVRGYINAEGGTYDITSGTVKVKLNAGGEHKFTFSDVKAKVMGTNDQKTLNGTVTISEF